MPLYQTVNGVAIIGEDGAIEALDLILQNFGRYILYVSGLDLPKELSRDGTILRPFRTIEDAFSGISADCVKILLTDGDYNLPVDFSRLNDFSIMLEGLKDQLFRQTTTFLGQIVLKNGYKDCHFKNITFSSQSGNASSSSVLIFDDYDGNAVFENCRFLSQNGSEVIKMSGSHGSTVFFRNCVFNYKSVFSQDSQGGGDNVIFLERKTIAPIIKMSESAGCRVSLISCKVGSCIHGGGNLTLNNVSFVQPVDGQDVIKSTAIKSDRNFLQLYFVDTKGEIVSNSQSSFGKINKTGDAMGFYWHLTKSPTFSHNLKGLTDLSLSTSSEAKNIIVGKISNNSVPEGMVVDSTDPKNVILKLAPANLTNAGVLTSESQEIGGMKVFNNGISLKGYPKKQENSLPVSAKKDENSGVDKNFAKVGVNDDGTLDFGRKIIALDKPKVVGPSQKKTADGTDVSGFYSYGLKYSPIYYTGDAYTFKSKDENADGGEIRSSFEVSYRGFVPPKYNPTSKEHGTDILGIWDNVYILDKFSGSVAPSRILKIEGSLTFPFRRKYNKNPFSGNPNAIDAWFSRPLCNFPGLVVELEILNPNEEAGIRDLTSGQNAQLFILNTTNTFDTNESINTYNGWRPIHPDPEGAEFFITVTFLEDKANSKAHNVTKNPTNPT